MERLDDCGDKIGGSFLMGIMIGGLLAYSLLLTLHAILGG